jgi:hypothetical protein
MKFQSFYFIPYEAALAAYIVESSIGIASPRSGENSGLRVVPGRTLPVRRYAIPATTHTALQNLAGS